MLPGELKASDFHLYPPQARELAAAHLKLLRELPLIFAPILLRELMAYDWKFPVERKELVGELGFLETSHESELTSFAALTMPDGLEKSDWVNQPGSFVEQLTAYLWSSHQMDAFREAAASYAQRLRESMKQALLAAGRLGIVVVGAGVEQEEVPLFRKLRPQGVSFTAVRPEGAWTAIFETIAARAKTSPAAYGHWYIDGGALAASDFVGITCVSYSRLAVTRMALLKKMQLAMSSQGMGPEAMRTLLAQTVPEDLGLTGSGESGVLNRFQVSLLTEGSGTQIFSTTFAQWAAREVLRRAKPQTLLVRYAPRQRQKAMNEMLFGVPGGSDVDPAGSLVDADMGAYYTWLNLQRLAGAESSRFLVWFEGHGQAVAIGPSMAAKTTSNSPIEMGRLLKMLL